MRRLLLTSGMFCAIVLSVMNCGTSEDTMSSDDGETLSAVDSTDVVDPMVETDSSKAITHGVPNQAELDSIKKAKTDKKKKE